MKKKEINMKNYIYILKDPTNGEVVYVGKTKDPNKRNRDHRRRCKGKFRSLLDKWKNQIMDVGQYPIMEVIDEFDTSEINFWEKFYISEYKLKYNLLNMTEGGDGLQNPSEEVRRKIGEKSKGRVHDDDTKRKISEKIYNHTGNRIVCYDKDKKIIGYFRNSRRASEKLNVSFKNISKILNGDEYFIKGYTFFLENEENIPTKIEERLSKTIEFQREFYRISKDGDIVKYNNLMKAADDNKCSYKNIWLCLNGKRKTCNQFAWSYKPNFEYHFFYKKTRAKKCKLTKIDGYVIIFESLEDAKNKTGINKSTICGYLKNKIKPQNGDIWQYYF
jgi:hypothetical protein